MKLGSAIALAIVLLVSGVAFATTARAVTLEELTKTSDLVLVGRVQKLESSISEGRVYTTISIETEEVWKGSYSPALVKIRQLGGRTPELTTRVAGLPDFDESERVLVFLNRRANKKFYSVSGLAQGKYRVNESGELIHNMNGLELVGTSNTLPGANRVTLEETRQKISKFSQAGLTP